MAAWYSAHIEAGAAASFAAVDTEALALEFWEALRLGAPNRPRLDELARAYARMPWNAHLVEVLASHGFDDRVGFSPDGPRPSCGALLAALVASGGGANPMPFPVPRFAGCEVRARQTVATIHGDVTFDHVLVTADGRGYGLVKNLQTCIYGKVRHGVELEPAAAAPSFFRSPMAATAAQWRATDRQVAIKCIERAKYEQHVSRHRGRLNEDPIKEVAVMHYVAAKGGAPYCLGLLGCYADDATVYAVLPFCPHGDLFGLVESRGGGLAEATAARYFGQVVAGLERLHAMGLAHHDMSLENLMLDDAKRAVVIDFGMAVKASPTFTRFLDAPPPPPPGQGHARSACGAPYFALPLAPRRGWPCRCGKLLYMAPELFDPREPFDVFAADVWALGIILFLLLTGMPPWDAATGPTAQDMRYVYVRDGRLGELLTTWDIHLSDHAPDLLQRLLTADPKARLTLPELKGHPWWVANATHVQVPV